jgi:hypothetical protein
MYVDSITQAGSSTVDQYTFALGVAFIVKYIFAERLKV